MTEPAGFAPGLLAAHQIERLLEAGAIACSAAPADAPPILQPASLDLRLGRRAWRIRASFLPGQGRSVLDGIGAQAADELDLTVGRASWSPVPSRSWSSTSGSIFPGACGPRRTRRARPGASTSSPGSSRTGPGASTRSRPATRARSIPRSRPAPSRSACGPGRGWRRSASRPATRGSTTRDTARCTPRRRWWRAVSP